ncbi:MAG TPA: transcriptional repressor [Solirubrobacteraceae bacterium]|jgi:Fur family ferric uptake transcriptional regulator/Fur family peroxide stress response transcriptional regulator
MTDTNTNTSALSSDDRALIGLLRSRGQRTTSQRLVILRELRRRRRHASAEQIREAIGHDLPGISAPTVYATLDLFVELGLARKLDVGTGVSLFDGRIDPHQHTVCRVCGRVEDLDGPFDPDALTKAAGRDGFEAEQVDVVIRGLCADCTS